MRDETVIPWTPSLPSSWAVQRAKTLVYRSKSLNSDRSERQVLSLTLRGVVDNDPENPEGLVPEDFATYQLFEPDDLVFKLIDLENVRTSRVGLVPKRGIMSSAYLRLRPRPGVCVRFLYWSFFDLYNRQIFNHLGSGVRSTLGAEDVLDLPLPVPPLANQWAIADYLDAETTRIDALIAKKQRMIELLDERFQTAIRVRLSNIAAPVLPLKRAWRVIDCKHRTPDYVDEGYPVVSPGDVSPGRLNLSRATRFVSVEDLDDLADGPRRPRRGDIIYSRNASIGTAAYVDTEDRFCMGQDVCLITSVEHDQLFLTYVLNTVGLDQLDVLKIGSTFSRVNISQIVELLVPVPARSEQEEIAGELDRASAQVGLAQDRLRQQVSLLREQRQALITAAVTGELEVPGVAA